MGKINIDTKIDLNNGIKIPIFGLGTYLNDNGKRAIESMLYALEIGYRHLDTAAMYETLQKKGRPIVFTSMILFFGFVILGFSKFMPTAYFGMYIIIP